MSQRDKLKYIIEQYGKKKYTTSDFCNLFVDILYHQKDGSITNEEISLLDKYGSVFSRFASSGEGVELGFLFDEKQILKKFHELVSEWK